MVVEYNNIRRSDDLINPFRQMRCVARTRAAFDIGDVLGVGRVFLEVLKNQPAKCASLPTENLTPMSSPSRTISGPGLLVGQ